MTLQYRPLGLTNLRVSSIGLGCVTFGREIGDHCSFDILDRAVQRGINLLDTAAVYGNGASEELVGRWLRDRGLRASIVLATKVSGRLTRKNIMLSVDDSLKRLGVEQIDLLQAHDWDAETPVNETLEAFQHLIKQGKIRHYGCSNWSVKQMEKADAMIKQHHWQRIETAQVPYSLVRREIERELIPYCNQRHIGVITYSPLGAGFLTGKYQPGGAIPTGTRFDIKPNHQQIYFSEQMFQIVEQLRRLASQSGHTMAHLALSWALHRTGTTTVLIGARNPEQVDQALHALNDLPADAIHGHGPGSLCNRCEGEANTTGLSTTSSQNHDADNVNGGPKG